MWDCHVKEFILQDQVTYNQCVIKQMWKIAISKKCGLLEYVLPHYFMMVCQTLEIWNCSVQASMQQSLPNSQYVFK